MRGWTRVLGVTLAAMTVACAADDHATLDMVSLTLTPCDGRSARTFEPFHRDFPFVRSLRSDGQPPWILEMIAGERAVTESDVLVLQFADVAAVRKALDASPDHTLPIDGTQVRLSLALLETCPDATQSLEARSGTLRLDRFDPDGGAAGLATFDLADRRVPGDPPLATGARFEFDVAVRDRSPYQPYTR